MNLEAFFRRLQVDETPAERIGFNPYYPRLEAGLNEPLRIDGRDMIDLASNNYLGLACDRRVTQAITTAVEAFGASLCGTPIATGSFSLFRRLEHELAAFVGLPAATILPSGYQANNGLFSAIADRNDVFVIDHFAHSSLVQGVRAVGGKIRPFLHNNPEHLHTVLRALKTSGQVFVVTESVFSTEGSIAPFREIVDLCQKFQAVPVVDDSHGIGVLGKRGRGILEHCDLSDYPGLYTASLGKALANAGGFIAGPQGVVNRLKYYCPHLVYSTALPPGVLGGITAVLKIISADFPNLSGRLWFARHRLRESLLQAGFSLAPGEAPINSISSGTMGDTLRLAKLFFEEGILVTPFVEPSVPPGEGRVRLIAGAGLSDQALETVESRLPLIFHRFQATVQVRG